MVFRSREEQSENTRSQHQGWTGWGYHRLLTFATNGRDLLIFIYFIFVKLREREGQRVDLGKSLNLHDTAQYGPGEVGEVRGGM